MRMKMMAGALALAACGPSGPRNAADITDHVASKAAIGGEHLLVEPIGNPESLLGRAVTRNEKGQMLIAESRAPGCTVRVKKDPSAWTRTFQEAIQNVGGVSASVPLFAQLQASYGEKLFVLFEVDNAYILEADLAGTCGDNVVRSVKVGTGTRGFSSDYQADFEGEGRTAKAGAEGGFATRQGIKQALTWKQPQGWAFTVGARAEQNVQRLQMRLQTSGDRIADCEPYSLKITGDTDLYLIILHQDQDGAPTVIGPRQEAPEIKVPANATTEVGGMSVNLVDAKVATAEKFIVYGFTDRQEYERLLPPFGFLTPADTATYIDQLDKELAQIPIQRWEKKVIGFQITPQSPPRPTATCPE